MLTRMRSSSLMSLGPIPTFHLRSASSSRGLPLLSLKIYNHSISGRSTESEQCTYVDEALNTFCHVFGKFGPCDWSRRATEVLCRNLPAPLAVARPLRYRISTALLERNRSSHFEADGYAWTTALEDGLVTVLETLHSRVQSIR